MSFGFDKVHTMTGYYDGPREGIADFEGRPHLYQSEWNEGLDLYSDTFLLSPVDPDLFALALESWEIWRRWEAAFHAGLTPLETHPALPEDRARAIELDRILKPRLIIDPANCFRVRGLFQSVPPTEPGAFLGFGPLEVRWERIAMPSK
jgi:hypothetical protein